MNNELKFSFLTSAIADAQELIRFTDTKTAIATTLIGAYLVAALSAWTNVLKYMSLFSTLFWVMIFVFIILIILSIIVVTRIIKPTSNPLNNIKSVMGGDSNINDRLPIEPSFYIAGNEYTNFKYAFINSAKYKLKLSYSDYLTQMIKANDDDLIKVLALELSKVSFIRNLKFDRFHVLLWLLVITTLNFLVLFLMYSNVIVDVTITTCIK